MAFASSQCTCIKQRSCAPYPFNCFSPFHTLFYHSLSNNNLISSSVNIMSSHPETVVGASTVDENSAKSPSDTGCVSDDGSDNCLRHFIFESLPELPDEEYRTYSTSSLGVVNRRAETAAVEAWVGNNGLKCEGEHEVKAELPSAVSNIPDSRVTHTPSTQNTRNSKNTRDSKSRPVQRRNEQSGVIRRKKQSGRTTRVHTRSRGPVPSEEDGASTAGGNTAVKIKDDVGEISIKKEES